MFSSEDFKKFTGVSRDDSPEKLQAALGRKVHAEQSAAIAIALIVRQLVVEHNWQVSSSAAEVGLTASAAGVAGARGRVIYETGAASASIVWSCLLALPNNSLAELATTLQAMTTEEDRTNYVIAQASMKVVSNRLGGHATPKRIEDMTRALIADGHRTPVAFRGAVDGIASRLEVPLPSAEERKAAAGNTADRKAEQVPSAKAAAVTLAKFATDREEGSEGEDFALSPAEVADLVEVAKTAIRTLRMAGQHDALEQVQEFAMESALMI